jgi:hypothetical protein
VVGNKYQEFFSDISAWQVKYVSSRNHKSDKKNKKMNENQTTEEEDDEIRPAVCVDEMIALLYNLNGEKKKKKLCGA